MDNRLLITIYLAVIIGGCAVIAFELLANNYAAALAVGVLMFTSFTVTLLHLIWSD